MVIKELYDKREIEYKKAKDLEGTYFNEKISFEKKQELKDIRYKHIAKYQFYNNLIKAIIRSETDDKQNKNKIR